jgi:hypothetical protein
MGGVHGIYGGWSTMIHGFANAIYDVTREDAAATPSLSCRACPLVDRQHPHDLFMELAASYIYRLSPNGFRVSRAGSGLKPAV